MNTTLVRKQRRILTPTEVESHEAAIDQHKRDKVEDEFGFAGESRSTEVDDHVRRMMKTLKESAPRPLTKYEKQAFEKRALKLKEWLQKHMVPRSHVGLREQQGGVQNPEFRKAVDEMAKREMSSEFQSAAQEYKNIMRELGRSEEANLENIRPATR